MTYSTVISAVSRGRAALMRSRPLQLNLLPALPPPPQVPILRSGEGESEGQGAEEGKGAALVLFLVLFCFSPNLNSLDALLALDFAGILYSLESVWRFSVKVWLQEKGTEPCGPLQLGGLLRPCHLPSLPSRLCPCLCFPTSVASVLCHLGPLGLSLPLLPSQPRFAALPLTSALFLHLSSSSPFLFVFLAFSLLPRLGFPSNERVPGKEGSLRPWTSPADPAPSCDLPAC